jgi:tRNA threonylcarbamoyl adenosine modification protein YeaZ
VGQRVLKILLISKRPRKYSTRDHYGLEKIKERVLEFLSVRKLNPKTKGPILCFVGPPGVGKTSLGQAIAKAMKRKFVRISLGGIRDEAEIRGHRRTYIGALPGRILQGLKQCGSNNPVFMMDEIDKLGSDFRGDPSSALLEALDPEQNFAFSDHYLNIPFDLSKVMFILTANMTDTIPSALLDRMEVINLSGYTEEEKMAIAKNFLLPRQIKENGLKLKNIVISPGAMLQIIQEYTYESGLRNLERELGSICRKVARKIAEGEKGFYKITQNVLPKYLGIPKYLPEMDQDESQVGLCTGLAWTYTGGEVLYVEAALIGGKGELIMTGQIGEVMQESARAALSYARANLPALGIDENIFDNLDLHIHVPAGAIPKDGPSAGIAMATALISVLSNKPVSSDVAMTGEITLRGRVLPVGGLKEKALGALRGGIKTVIIPEKNRKELSEIPKNIRRKLKFVFPSVIWMKYFLLRFVEDPTKTELLKKHMKILAVDTATQHCSVAVCQDLALLAEMTLFRRQTHSKHLLEMIHQTISISGIKLNEINAFAVTRGPGSFTGLRIGLSCAKGLAYALDKPIASVSSLESLATQALGRTGNEPLLICPILDARKKEVYFAAFKHLHDKIVNVTPEMVLPPEKLALHIDGPCVFIGDGAILYKEILTKTFKNAAIFAPYQQNYIRAHTVALLAFERLKDGDMEDISSLVPQYIRQSDAERKLF